MKWHRLAIGHDRASIGSFKGKFSSAPNTQKNDVLLAERRQSSARRTFRSHSTRRKEFPVIRSNSIRYLASHIIARSPLPLSSKALGVAYSVHRWLSCAYAAKCYCTTFEGKKTPFQPGIQHGLHHPFSAQSSGNPNLEAHMVRSPLGRSS